MQDKEVMTAENAELELQRFADAMDLDIDASRMDESDKKSFESTKYKLIRAMQRGRLVIDDKGQPIYSPAHDDAGSVTFHQPTGSMIAASDGKKDTENIKRLNAIMGEMTHCHPSRFANMKLPDLKVCQAIAALFLG